MAEGFVKLWASILDSSVWSYEPEIRIVWITLLAMADKDGFIHAAIPGIANRARVSVEVTERAMVLFQEPDPYSRSSEHEGRRIALKGRDWLILNFEEHRARMSKESAKQSKRKWWHENKVKLDTTREILDTPRKTLEATRNEKLPLSPPHTPPLTPTYTEAYPEADSNIYNKDGNTFNDKQDERVFTQDDVKEFDHMQGLTKDIAVYLREHFPDYGAISLIDTARVLAQLADKMTAEVWQNLIHRCARRFSGNIEWGGKDKLRASLVNWFENEARGTFKPQEEPEPPKKVLTPEEKENLRRYHEFEGFK